MRNLINVNLISENFLWDIRIAVEDSQLKNVAVVPIHVADDTQTSAVDVVVPFQLLQNCACWLYMLQTAAILLSLVVVVRDVSVRLVVSLLKPLIG